MTGGNPVEPTTAIATVAAWHPDPDFYVNVASVVLTAILSSLLFVTSWKATKAAEAATDISQALFEERQVKARYRRTVLLGKADMVVADWIEILSSDSTVAQQLLTLKGFPPLWDEEEVAEVSTEPDFAGDLLRVTFEYRKLMKLLRQFPGIKSPSGPTVHIPPEDEPAVQRLIEEFGRSIIGLATEIQHQNDKPT